MHVPVFLPGGRYGCMPRTGTAERYCFTACVCMHDGSHPPDDTGASVDKDMYLHFLAPNIPGCWLLSWA